MLVEVKSLSRYYGKRCAVKNLSFQLKKGQVLGFLGVNGAGKTTTMQMLTGNLAAHSGEVFINGVDLWQQPLQAKQHLGYLPDTPPLYKELTVSEYLYYCAQLHKVPKSEQTKAVSKTLESCGLTDVTNKLIAALSKGYQQRLGIAQAILHNPDVIILDEPTVGLDPLQIKEIRTLIKELGKEHGVILSTHILPEVLQVCSDVQIIHQGELVLKQTVAELNQQMQTAQIKLITRSPIDEEKLKELEMVIQVEKTAECEYLIYHQNNTNPIEALTEVVIAHSWGLEEIAPLKRSLEDIFMALTNEVN